MSKWPIIHEYRRAVANGKALPVLCPDCKGELVPVAGRDDEPALRCLSCRVVFELGLHVWDQIKNALRDVR